MSTAVGKKNVGRTVHVVFSVVVTAVLFIIFFSNNLIKGVCGMSAAVGKKTVGGIVRVIFSVVVTTVLLIGCVTDEDDDNAINLLPEADYVSGAITTSNKEEWFKFTATVSTHYIHVKHGTLSDFSVQLYDSKKNAVGNRHDYHESQLDGYGGWYSEINVTKGKLYYLKVTPYSSSGVGTYQISCWTSILSPMSRNKAKVLAFDTWISGSITLDGGDDEINLYKFTATSATTHYIHINLGTLTQVYIRLYDGNGSIVQNRTSLSKSGYVPYQYLTSGDVYYISLWSDSRYGTYQIALNTRSTAP